MLIFVSNMKDFSANISKIERYEVRINEQNNFHCRFTLTSVDNANELTEYCLAKGIDTAQFSYPDSEYVHFVCKDKKSMLSFIDTVIDFDNKTQPDIKTQLESSLNDKIQSKLELENEQLRQQIEQLKLEGELVKLENKQLKLERKKNDSWQDFCLYDSFEPSSEQSETMEVINAPILFQFVDHQPIAKNNVSLKHSKSLGNLEPSSAPIKASENSEEKVRVKRSKSLGQIGTKPF